MTARPFLQEFADWVEAFDFLAPDDRRDSLEEARRCFVDTAACVIAGRLMPQYESVLDAGVALGAEDTAGFAAFGVGTAAHALDFDDYEFPASTHPSAPIVGAVLAAHDPGHHRVEDLLAAYVVGYEAIVAMGRWMGYGHYERGWHATSTIGVLGAAAGAAHMIGLRGERLAHSVALAASMSAGLKVQFGTATKAVHAGLAARGGLESAFLVANGVRATVDVIETDYGFVDNFSGDNAPGWQERPTFDEMRPAIIEHRPARKAWPSCGYTQRCIEAALRLEHEIDDWTSVASVTIRLPEPFYRVAPFRNPTSEAEARFSISHCVASALVDGVVGLSSFTEHALGRADVGAVEDRIVFEPYDAGPDLDDMSSHHPDSLLVRTTTGLRLHAAVHDVHGGPSRPFTSAELTDKYGNCGGDRTLVDRAFTAALDAPSTSVTAMFAQPSEQS